MSSYWRNTLCYRWTKFKWDMGRLWRLLNRGHFESRCRKRQTRSLQSIHCANLLPCRLYEGWIYGPSQTQITVASRQRDKSPSVVECLKEWVMLPINFVQWSRLFLLKPVIFQYYSAFLYHVYVTFVQSIGPTLFVKCNYLLINNHNLNRRYNLVLSTTT